MPTLRHIAPGVLVHSPIAADPASVAHLGKPRWVLAPNRLHDLYVGPWAAAGLEAWAAPGLPKKRPDLRFQGEITTAAASPFGADVALMPLACFGYTDEVALLHRPSRTLVVSDLVFNFPPRHRHGRRRPDRFAQSLTPTRPLSALAAGASIPAVDVTPYLPNLRRREAEAATAARDRASAARERLPELVRLLAERFGVHRVVLFGSLLRGELHERSDLDLAVSGLARERYWEALAACHEVAGRHVDLVPLEDASPSLRERIETEGEPLLG